MINFWKQFLQPFRCCRQMPVLRNKHCVNSLPVLLSFQLPSPKAPTRFHSLDPEDHSVDLHGKRAVFGAKPIRGGSPPILGAFTLCWEGGPLVWGKGCTDLEDSWALHGFLQEEGADLYISHQPCPYSRRCLRVSPAFSLCGFRVNCLLNQVLQVLERGLGIFRNITFFPYKEYSQGIRQYLNRQYTFLCTFPSPAPSGWCCFDTKSQFDLLHKITDCSVSTFKFGNTPQPSKSTKINLQFKGWGDLLHYK